MMTFHGVQGALVVRHLNTLHGFNCYTDGTYLILGILTWSKGSSSLEPDRLTCIAAVREGLKLTDEEKKEYQTFDFISGSYGGDCLQLPIKIRERAGLAIDAARKIGYRVCLQTRLRAGFPAHTWATHPFSKEEAERIAVRAFKEAEVLWKLAPDIIYKDKACVLGDRRLWCTDEGKQLADHIKQLYPQEVDDPKTNPIFLKDQPLHASPKCPFDFPPISAPAAAAAAAAADAGIKQMASGGVCLDNKKDGEQTENQKENDGKKECVVCLAAFPDTLVLPCMHCVVCRSCSAKLKNTPDANTCIQCRKPLTEVIHIAYD